MNTQKIPLTVVSLFLLFAMVSNSFGTANAAISDPSKPGDTGQTEPGSETELSAAPQDSYSTYLPQALRQQNRYAFGKVTDRHAPVNGAVLELRYYNGVEWSTLTTTSTDSTGYYSFTSPKISGDELYYVRWRNAINGDNNTRLAGWLCDSVAPDSPTGTSECNFDLENIIMVSPKSGSSVVLPSIFQWQTRQTLTDSYEYDLYDRADSDPYFYSPLLGFATNYTLNSLPSGFLSGTQYAWNVWAKGPNGIGSSFYYRSITFSAGSSGGVTVNEAPIEHQVLEKFIREIEAQYLEK